MSARLTSAMVAPLPGAGVVWRQGSALVVFPGLSSTDAAEGILAAVGSGDDDGRIIARRIASRLLDDASAPGFCLIAETDGRHVVMVHGAVSVLRQGQMIFRGDDSPTWVDGFIDDDRELAIVGSADTAHLVDDRWNLAAGIIPAAGAVVVFTGESPRALAGAGADAADQGDVEARLPDESRIPISDEAVTGETPEVAAPASSDARDPDTNGFEIIDLSQPPVEPRTPLPTAEDEDETDRPMVSGVRCSRGHFNHPHAVYCNACGIKMVHATKISVQGVRPPLGLLVADDGTTYSLDAGYVIGREPGLDAAVRDGVARPIVAGDAGTMSRVHAEIRLDGWEVQVVDRGSTNGTFVREGDTGWQQLQADEPYALSPGMEISLGDRRMVFESGVVPLVR